jgi:hypothetical protein
MRDTGVTFEFFNEPGFYESGEQQRANPDTFYVARHQQIRSTEQ